MPRRSVTSKTPPDTALVDSSAEYLVARRTQSREAATTQRYAHLAADPVKRAADRISGVGRKILGTLNNRE